MPVSSPIRQALVCLRHHWMVELSESSDYKRPVNRSQIVALVVLTAALGLSVGSVISSSNRLAIIPDAQVVKQAVDLVRNDFEPGDAVRVEPYWNENLWLPLQNMGTGTNRFPFPAFLKGAFLDPVTLMKYKQVWVIGTYAKSARLPEALAAGSSETFRKKVGPGVEVARYTLPALGVTASLTDDFSKLKVSRKQAKKTIPCPLRGKRFVCGKKGWENPSIDTRDVFHNEVTWLMAHAPRRGQTLKIDWKPAKGKSLIVRTGFTLEGVRKDAGDDTTVTVYVGDKQVSQILLSPNRYILARRLIALPADTPPKIRFEVSTKQHDYRQVMLQADVVDQVPDPVKAWINASP